MSIVKINWCCVYENEHVLAYRAVCGPVIFVLSFLEWSKEFGRSLGSGCTTLLGVVSIACCEALDTRSNERCVRRVAFASREEGCGLTSPEADGPSLASELRWLLPSLVEASGVADFEKGRAALAAPPWGRVAVASVRCACFGRPPGLVVMLPPVAPLRQKKFSLKIKAKDTVVLPGN